jgi:hypothetical protein
VDVDSPGTLRRWLPTLLIASSQEVAIVPYSGVREFMVDYLFPRSLLWQPIRPSLLPEGVCGL